MVLAPALLEVDCESSSDRVVSTSRASLKRFDSVSNSTTQFMSVKPMLTRVCCALLLFLLANRVQARAAADATVTPLTSADGVHSGSDVRLALKVHLPDGYHTNSN